MTNDITAGSKFTVNFNTINFRLGIRVLELYMNNTTNLIVGTAPFLYSKKDLIEFFVGMEISGDMIENASGVWYFHSPNDLTNRAINYFMALEYSGVILHVTADGVLPTVYSAATGNNFINPVNAAAHPGMGLSFRLFVDGLPIFSGPMPSSVTDNNTFLTWLNTNYSQYGSWKKTYDTANRVTNYTLNSINSHLVSLLLGTDAATLLNVNVVTAQVITFPAVPSMSHLAANYTLLAVSPSGLPITYVSSNPSFGTIVNGNQLHPVAAGTFNITASQAGNTDFAAATPVVNAVTLT